MLNRPIRLGALALSVLGLTALAVSPGSAAGSRPNVVRAVGRAKVIDAVERYRAILGPNNGGEPGSRGSGRREINWDGVPDELAAPNALPGDFFNAPTAPRARGAVLATPGDHVAVSADSDNPAHALPRFGDINASYAEQFQTFSAERLFSPVGSNVVDMTFRVPGSDVPAAVRGFGAVYTDVDLREGASFEYYDRAGRRLGSFSVPAAPQGLSFLGVAYPAPVVSRVRIRYGSTALGPNDSRRYDVAVMDDFIFGEPVPF